MKKASQTTKKRHPLMQQRFKSKYSILSTVRHAKSNNTNELNSSSLFISNQRQAGQGSCLFIIDPQNDFVTGSLSVPGAVEDCKRIAKFIDDNIDILQEIYVTLDSHMSYHVAHPLFWYVGNTFEHPKVFTQITYKDLAKGKYRTVDSDMQEWALHYTKTLSEESRLPGLEAFTLTIWPPHCLLGTLGHNVVPSVHEAITRWETRNVKSAHYIIKGNNSKTEHYSAFRAEVVVPEDPTTDFNYILYNNLQKHAKIFVAGEAKSHCVNFTVRDLVEELGSERSKEKIVLLEGGMSSVSGCEKLGNDFWKDMTSNRSNKDGGLGLKTVKISLEEKVAALGFGLKHVDISI